MTGFTHVPAAADQWIRFAAADATHAQLVGLSDSVDSDAVWLARRDADPTTRVAPSQAGLYRMSVGDFEFESPGDEMCYVVSGSAEVVVEDGATVSLRPGDMAFWPRGLNTTWRVTHEFVQFFTMIG